MVHAYWNYNQPVYQDCHQHARFEIQVFFKEPKKAGDSLLAFLAPPVKE